MRGKNPYGNWKITGYNAIYHKNVEMSCTFYLTFSFQIVLNLKLAKEELNVPFQKSTYEGFKRGFLKFVPLWVPQNKATVQP